MVDKFKEFMELTNSLKNIQCQVRELPCGKWGGKRGELGAMFIRGILKKHLHFVDTSINIQSNDHEAVISKFLQEFDDYRSYFEFFRFFAQKKSSNLTI